MTYSTCTVSFFRNDLQKSRLPIRCPIKDCHSHTYKVPFQRYQVPFCPEHGLRIHKNGFVYYNGTSTDALAVATKRNLMFHGDYYIEHFLKKGNKMESGRLCYENSEDSVSYNVFTSLLSDMQSIRKLASHITKKEIHDDVELLLWGGKIDLAHNNFTPFEPLLDVRKHLEHDIKQFATEPDIMLVAPKKFVICIEAKFGSKNPIADDSVEKVGEKPKGAFRLIERYCTKNRILDTNEIFDFGQMPDRFYEQLFRNVVFSACMAKLSNAPEWYVVNLRNRHLMNLRRGQPESMPIKRNIRSILRWKHKNRFSHLTWEEIYDLCVKGNPQLSNLAWYLKNKSLGCSRAFNIF